MLNEGLTSEELEKRYIVRYLLNDMIIRELCTFL
jgi:hypothetical protein